MARERGAPPGVATVVADVSAQLAPWSGITFCTGPRDESLDVARLVTRDSNRWSDNDEPTLYIAGDPGVALAELGRHWGERGAPAAVWSLRVDLAAVIDLREPAAQRSLGLPEDPAWILDVDGVRLVIAALSEESAFESVRAEVREIVESIDIEP